MLMRCRGQSALKLNMPRVLVFLLALICCSKLATAGDYRNGYQRPNRTQEEQQYNHQPLELMATEDLPEHWDWCDVNGPDLCTPSWNQHEPVCKLQALCKATHIIHYLDEGKADLTCHAILAAF